ncbi:hypothetical protein [Pseudobutyrivibrio ruminis]|uniref:hypothetical protein n=1 Tax=Pseudobutyrivibrio ruminis TaxID=46206 RepID=UPI00051AF0FD|nr:hypothetical protein [Pseudobutyrivibrio ruminis]
MKRLIKSIVIFTFVMVAGLTLGTAEVRAEEDGAYFDGYAVHIQGDGRSNDELTAAYEAACSELAAQYEAEEKASQSTSSSSSSSSATNQKTSSAPKYTDAEIEAAWVESSRTEATCAKDGVITYKNSLTGKTKTEAIPATGEHSYALSEHVDSTCVNNGYDTYTCSTCGDVYSDELPLAEHVKSDAKVTKMASSFSEGERKIYCSVCDDLITTEVIPQTCPIPLAVVLAFGAGAVVFIIGALSLIRKN